MRDKFCQEIKYLIKVINLAIITISLVLPQAVLAQQSPGEWDPADGYILPGPVGIRSYEISPYFQAFTQEIACGTLEIGSSEAGFQISYHIGESMKYPIGLLLYIPLDGADVETPNFNNLRYFFDTWQVSGHYLEVFIDINGLRYCKEFIGNNAVRQVFYGDPDPADVSGLVSIATSMINGRDIEPLQGASFELEIEGLITAFQSARNNKDTYVISDTESILDRTDFRNFGQTVYMELGELLPVGVFDVAWAERVTSQITDHGQPYGGSARLEYSQISSGKGLVLVEPWDPVGERWSVMKKNNGTYELMYEPYLGVLISFVLESDGHIKSATYVNRDRQESYVYDNAELGSISFHWTQGDGDYVPTGVFGGLTWTEVTDSSSYISPEEMMARLEELFEGKSEDEIRDLGYIRIVPKIDLNPAARSLAPSDGIKSASGAVTFMDSDDLAAKAQALRDAIGFDVYELLNSPSPAPSAGAGGGTDVTTAGIGGDSGFVEDAIAEFFQMYGYVGGGISTILHYWDTLGGVIRWTYDFTRTYQARAPLYVHASSGQAYLQTAGVDYNKPLNFGDRDTVETMFQAYRDWGMITPTEYREVMAMYDRLKSANSVFLHGWDDYNAEIPTVVQEFLDTKDDAKLEFLAREYGVYKFAFLTWLSVKFPDLAIEESRPVYSGQITIPVGPEYRSFDLADIVAIVAAVWVGGVEIAGLVGKITGVGTALAESFIGSPAIYGMVSRALYFSLYSPLIASANGESAGGFLDWLFNFGNQFASGFIYSGIFGYVFPFLGGGEGGSLLLFNLQNQLTFAVSEILLEEILLQQYYAGLDLPGWGAARLWDMEFYGNLAEVFNPLEIYMLLMAADKGGIKTFGCAMVGLGLAAVLIEGFERLTGIDVFGGE